MNAEKQSPEAEYREHLLERDKADCKALPIQFDATFDIVWLKGFNAGLEVARLMVKTAKIGG